MRILQVSKYYPPHPGGIESHVEQLSRALSRDHEVTVVAFDDRPGARIEEIASVKVLRFGARRALSSQPISLAYLRAVGSLRADVVHAHIPNPLAAFGLVHRRSSAPIIVTHHADIRAKTRLLAVPARAYTRRLLRRASAVVCASRRLAETAADLDGARDKVRVIPFGLDEDAFRLDPSSDAEARGFEALRAPGEVLTAFVGRLVPYKGLDVLLRASAQVPAARILIGGAGPEEASLRGLAAALGVADRVHFLGRLSESAKVGLLHACDMFCLSSNSAAEAFGIVLVEAQLCGKPVIASRLPTGVSEVAIDGETALCFDPGDVAGLASAITRLASEPQLARRLAERGRENARARYTRAAVDHTWRALFDEVGAGRGGAAVRAA